MPGGKSFHLGFPKLLAGHGIHGVDERAAVAEECGIAWAEFGLDAADADSCAHAPGRVEEPANAARRGIDRINRAAGAADKNASAGEGRVGVGVQRGRKSEGPLDLQLANIRGADSSLRGGLKARVQEIQAPAVPLRASGGIGEVRRRFGTHGGRCGRRIQGVLEGFARDEFGDGAAIGGRAAVGHRDHGAGFHGRQNPLGRHGVQSFVSGSAFRSGVVARRATALVQGSSDLCGDKGGGPKEEQGTRDRAQRIFHLGMDFIMPLLI